MKSIFLSIVFGIFLKAGHIVDRNNNHVYTLTCPDSTECYVDLELKEGNYVYVSDTNRITLIVTDSSVYQLGEQTLRIIQ